MTPQEQELLASLTQKINQTELQEKDPEAEDFLRRELGPNPDAVYMLAQTVLVQNIALDQAKAQIGQLQQQLQQAQARPQPAHTTSFLGRLLGDKDPQPAPPTPPQGQGWGAGPQQAPPYQPVPQYGQPQYAPAPPVQYQAQPQYVPGQPSFLRGAMQTAAGVAAGALAFEGIESILHGFGNPGGYGMSGMGMGPGMGMGGGFGRPVEETVINNYYDEPGTRGFDHDRPEGEHHGHEGAQFADSGNDSGLRDDLMDDSSNDDGSSSDDTAGFDGGGGDDGGSGFDGGGGFDDGGGDQS